jgi:hypothetical protein
MMRQLSERWYFGLCRTLGWILRAGKYSRVRRVTVDGEIQVRKHRVLYAPLVVWLGGPLFRMLDTGVEVLALRQWQDRERLIYEALGRSSVRIAAGGVLVLPRLSGESLASLLENRRVDDPVRRKAIERTVAALADFHSRGFTHGDAMAENVLVDLDAGVAHWLDFETLHDSSRPLTWRRADDLRALVVTCLARTDPASRAETLQLIRDAYGDPEMDRLLAANFSSVFRRPLAFHLAQAGMSFACFGEIGRLLRESQRQALRA